MITKKSMENLARKLRDCTPPPGPLRHLWIRMAMDIQRTIIPLEWLGAFRDSINFTHVCLHAGDISKDDHAWLYPTSPPLAEDYRAGQRW